MASTTDMKPYLADSMVRLALRVVQENPDLGVVLTTDGGSRYLVVNEDGMFIGSKKERGKGREIKPGSRHTIGSQLIDFEMVNIWGSLKFGPWTTTKVVKVELKRRGESGGSSLFTLFEV